MSGVFWLPVIIHCISRSSGTPAGLRSLYTCPIVSLQTTPAPQRQCRPSDAARTNQLWHVSNTSCVAICCNSTAGWSWYWTLSKPSLCSPIWTSIICNALVMSASLWAEERGKSQKAGRHGSNGAWHNPCKIVCRLLKCIIRIYTRWSTLKNHCLKVMSACTSQACWAFALEILQFGWEIITTWLGLAGLQLHV